MPVLDSSVPCYRFFEEITKIPHGSYQEEKIADYIENFAKERNLKYFRDEMHNVIIYKDASVGFEDSEPVMLQGHIDMVNEKNKDVDHDFSKDALQIYIDEKNWLHAKGTTLGADDGTAVAYMLSILDDNTLSHPALDCVFTVQEEVGLFGASNIKKENVRARRLINMDGGGESVTSVSSSGGLMVDVEKETVQEANTLPTYELSITGLLGGHSGGAIHMERGNSNKILFRILHDLYIHNVDLHLVYVEGGLKANAIPREAFATFASATDLKTIQEEVEKTTAKLKVELEFSDAGLVTSLKQVETSPTAMSTQLSADIIRMIFLFPNGFKARSMKIEGLTTVSLNLGVIRLENDVLTCNFSLRSPMEGAMEDLYNQIHEIATIFNAKTIKGVGFPGWSYEENSPLREVLRQLIKDKLDKDLIEHAGHGGLETGIFKGTIPEMDIVTFGPISKGAHTPDECLDLDSFKRCYDLLLELLIRLK